ncbi:TPA: EamA family transporter [Candidatus Woesearchaeota archaeon]|nr:EamA family transporter [Candidatus Woesearchaeota archaeon]
MATPIWTMGVMVVVSIIGATAMLFIKQAAPTITFNIWKLLKNWKLIVGLGLFCCSTILSLIAFKFGELSVLYPFLALQYIITSILSIKYLAEKMGWLKWAGIMLIVFGVGLIGFGA